MYGTIQAIRARTASPPSQNGLLKIKNTGWSYTFHYCMDCTVLYLTVQQLN